MKSSPRGEHPGNSATHSLQCLVRSADDNRLLGALSALLDIIAEYRANSPEVWVPSATGHSPLRRPPKGLASLLQPPGCRPFRVWFPRVWCSFEEKKFFHTIPFCPTQTLAINDTQTLKIQV